MSGFAIAFGGGGGKGAYQMGIFRALYEKNMLSGLKAAAGTSVGALNAVLIALGDYETARDIWYSITPETLLSPTGSLTNGLCSRDGLHDILTGFDYTRLKNAPPVYINIHDLEDNCTKSVLINGLPKERIIEVLLASTALPVLYGNVDIEGKSYGDGGFPRSGLVPVAPLYESGIRRIIAVPLNDGYRLSDDYPEAEITVIKPSELLGTAGVIDFSPSGIRDRMVLGYKDALKALEEGEEENMRNRYVRMNVLIRDKMLKLFHSPDELEAFIKTSNFSNINIESRTLNREIFYENIAELYGWKVQQHKVTGLKCHYRILDDKNVRRAWVLTPKDLLDALENYEAAAK